MLETDTTIKMDESRLDLRASLRGSDIPQRPKLLMRLRQMWKKSLSSIDEFQFSACHLISLSQCDTVLSDYHGSYVVGRYLGE